jgi:hypothetical protein
MMPLRLQESDDEIKANRKELFALREYLQQP